MPRLRTLDSIAERVFALGSVGAGIFAVFAAEAATLCHPQRAWMPIVAFLAAPPLSIVLRAAVTPLLGRFDGFPWRRAVVIVVGSLIASIGLPNVMCFSCKSKQSEAKTNLSGLFTAEKAFFGEYNSYTTDLVSLNFAPDGQPAYVYGFGTTLEPAAAAKLHVAIPSHDPSRRTTLDLDVNARRMKTLTGRRLSRDDLVFEVPESGATGAAFLAAAVGDIDTDGTREELDVWTIDEQKHLLVRRNDCTQ